IKAGGHALVLEQLDSMAVHERQTLSALQRLLPLLSRASISESAPVGFDAPRGPDGRSVPAPPDWPHLLERELVVEGPMRALFLLPDELTQQVAWHSLVLTVDASAAPSLNRSR